MVGFPYLWFSTVAPHLNFFAVNGDDPNLVHHFCRPTTSYQKSTNQHVKRVSEHSNLAIKRDVQ